MVCNKDQNEQLSYVFTNLKLRAEGKMTIGDISDHSFRYIPKYSTMDVYVSGKGVIVDDIAVKGNDITLWVLDMKDNNISENHAMRENIGQFRDISKEVDVGIGFNLQVIDGKTGKEIPIDNFVILEQGSQYLTMHLNTSNNIKKESKMKEKQFTKKQIQEAIEHWKGILKGMNESAQYDSKRVDVMAFQMFNKMSDRDKVALKNNFERFCNQLKGALDGSSREVNESRLPGTVVVGVPADINKRVEEDSDVLIGNAKEFDEEAPFMDVVGYDNNFGVYCLGYFIKCRDYEEMASTVAQLSKIQAEYDEKFG